MPLVDGFDDTSSLSIGHLGIVAGAYHPLQIADVVDAALSKINSPPVHSLARLPRANHPSLPAPLRGREEARNAPGGGGAP